MFDGVIDRIFAGFDSRIATAKEEANEKVTAITGDIDMRLRAVEDHFMELSEQAKIVVGICIVLGIVDTCLLIAILRRL